MAGTVDAGSAFGALNAVLYCRRFEETARFYRDVLGLAPGHATDWFVEFRVAPGAFVSLADERRTTVKSAGGAGITLTLRVADAHAFRDTLLRRGLSPPPVEPRPWNALGFFIHDPEGTRLEIWSKVGVGPT